MSTTETSLTSREQEAWDVYQANPNATDDERGEIMGMTGGAYGNLRRNAAKKLGDPSYVPGTRASGSSRKPSVGPDPFEAVRRMAEQAQERVDQLEEAIQSFEVPEDKDLRKSVKDRLTEKANSLREQADQIEAQLGDKDFLATQLDQERERVSAQRDNLQSQLEQAKENLDKANQVVAGLPA